MKSQCAPVTNRAAQNAAQNVAAAFVRWNDSVRDREAERADVIGDDAECDVDLFLLACSCRAAVSAADVVSAEAPYNRQRRAYFLPLSFSISSKIGRKMSVS